jgi:hypothetical protein
MPKKPDEYLSEHIAARLLGIDAALLSRKAAAGEYGQTYRAPNGRRFISMKALQKKARRVFLFDPADPISPLDHLER